ncbi:MAG: TonB-dependent receptor [Bryobacteraceae bacterium]
MSDSQGDAALFADMPVVEAASLHSQTLAEAPGSVTIVTAPDIRKFGYRTLAEVLSSVRGFTVVGNHLMSSAGLRGFLAPGDVNTCFLVMVNGHPMTDIIGQSAGLFDQDFGLDLDLVERIEIIRGPSSALYGSNGILATINIITKAPADAPRFMATIEAGGVQPEKLEFMSSQSLGRGVNLLVEGSGYLNTGENLFVPGFNSPELNNGVARHVDAQSGYHSFMNLQWGAWNFFGYFNSHRQQAPILTSGTQFNDPAQFNRVSRNFAGASYTHQFASGAEVRWQIYYDHFHYGDRYDYTIGPGILDNRDNVTGDWISSGLTYSYPVPRVGLLTAGLNAQIELRSLVENTDYSPDHALRLRVSHPNRSIAPFVQQEWNLPRNWKAYVGVRLDESRNYGAFVSPRLALVYQPNTRSSYKFVYGRPFRAPSAYEAYYQSAGSQAANPGLRPESAQSVEISAERRLGRSMYALVNAYVYAMRSVIECVWLTNTVGQYQNLGSRNSHGIDFEFGGHPAAWLEMAGSIGLNRAKEGGSGLPLPNNPTWIAKGRAAIPIYRDRVFASSDMQYLSARTSITGASTRPVALVNATISTSRLARGFDIVAGMRNGLNWRYGDPSTWPLDATLDSIPAYGRSVFVKLIWTGAE